MIVLPNWDFRSRDYFYYDFSPILLPINIILHYFSIIATLARPIFYPCTEIEKNHTKKPVHGSYLLKTSSQVHRNSDHCSNNKEKVAPLFCKKDLDIVPSFPIKWIIYNCNRRIHSIQITGKLWRTNFNSPFSEM